MLDVTMNEKNPFDELFEQITNELHIPAIVEALSKIISHINRWLTNHQPVQCAICFRWIFRKDSVPEHATMGAPVRLCPTCHQNIFHPFTKA